MIIAVFVPGGTIVPRFFVATPVNACDGATVVILSADYDATAGEARLAIRNGDIPLEYGVLAVQDDEKVIGLTQRIIAEANGELSAIVENIPRTTTELVVRSATCPAAQDLVKLN